MHPSLPTSNARDFRKTKSLAQPCVAVPLAPRQEDSRRQIANANRDQEPACKRSARKFRRHCLKYCVDSVRETKIYEKLACLLYQPASPPVLARSPRFFTEFSQEYERSRVPTNLVEAASLYHALDRCGLGSDSLNISVL